MKLRPSLVNPAMIARDVFQSVDAMVICPSVCHLHIIVSKRLHLSKDFRHIVASSWYSPVYACRL